MGCGNSSPESEQAKRRNMNQKGGSNVYNKNKMKSQGAGSNDQGNPVSRFEQIIEGAKLIAAPANMMPVVCLNRDSFPIITSFLHLEDSTPTEIQLPIIAGSIFENGRIMCFAQLAFLGSKAIHTCDTSRLLLNSLVWVSGGVSSMTPILVVGFDKQSMQGVINSLQDLGFFAEVGKPNSYFANYKSIILPSNIELDDELANNLVEFVRNGGGMAIFYIYTDSNVVTVPVNKILAKFGLSFTYCLLNEGLDDADNIQVPPSFTYIRDSNFVPIAAHFKAVVKQSNIDTSTLDDLVTTLRYYIMVCDDTHTEQLTDIAEYAWDFLKRTEYFTSEGLCPDIKHGIVVVLLQDFYARLPVDKLPPIPESADFPGETGDDVTREDFELDLTLTDETWISTGLWLPAGEKGVITAEGEKSDIHVQIGSHFDSLLTKQGPWKRWPSVVSITPFEKSEETISSPFGGIVYITVNSPEPIEPRNEHFLFHGFCRHPRSKWDEPSIWENTKDIDVPWGEIDTGPTIFTLPSKELRIIGDNGHFDFIKERFDIIVDTISDYMSFNLSRPFRIVFDVEIVEDSPSSGYPIVFVIESIKDILLSNKDEKNDVQRQPTADLFKLVSLMAIVSIREDIFDVATEMAIAHVATAVVFQKLFHGFDPLKYDLVKMPVLFAELWEIHSKFDEKLIPQTLAKFQDTDYPTSEVPEDMWIAFVREMCRIGKRDFTKLLEKSRPIPLNILTSLQGLPVYQSPSN